MDDLRCSHWPKRRHLLVVVDFSLHFACVMSSEYTREFVMKFYPLKYFPFHRILKIAVKNSPIIWMKFDTGYKLQKWQTGSLFVYSCTISMVCFPVWNSRSEFFFARFSKIVFLVLLELIAIQELLKEYNALRQFCKPTLDRDKMIRSPAYKKLRI